MLTSLLRLIALRPLFGMAILGIPVIALIAFGLMAVLAVKLAVALIIPLALVVLVFWLVRRFARR